ncbi:MAG: LysR family transcriptional regulator [Christensenellales bacterium]|jgi:DNA-binding transcriptional LysR family regulator
MEIRQLRYFVQLAKSLNFSEAAKKLFITQQALSKSIKRTEERLGAELFVRSGSGISLSPYGEAILPDCMEIVETYDRKMGRILSLSPRNGTLLIISSSYAAMLILSPTLQQDFESAHPSFSMQVDEYPDIVAEEKLQNEEAELGLTIGVPIFAEEFDYWLLQKEPLSLLVSQGHPLYTCEHIEIQQLKGFPVYCAGKQFKTHRLLTEKCRAAGFEPLLKPVTSHIVYAYELVAREGGVVIGLLNAPASNYCKGFRSIPFKDPEMNWDIYLAAKKGRALSAAAQAFVNYMRKKFASRYLPAESD